MPQLKENPLDFTRHVNNKLLWITYHKLRWQWRRLAINDDSVMERAKLLRSWGRSSSLFNEHSESIENRFNVDLDGIEYDAKFVFESVGYNLEGNELGASFGLAQLEKLDQNIATRQENFSRQCNFFTQFSEFFSNPIESSDFETAWLAFPILIKETAPFVGEISDLP